MTAAATGTGRARASVTRIAVASVVLGACWTGGKAVRVERAAAATGARVICPEAAPGAATLMLPGAASVTDLSLAVDAPGGVRPPEWKGTMVVDGTVTTAPWPERAPLVYPLPDGRRLLYDAYNENRAHVWDPRTRALTDLGRVGMLPVGTRGWLIVTTGPRGTTYHDVDPAKPALRKLWTSPQHTRVLGELDGAVALFEQTAPTEVDGATVANDPAAGAATHARRAGTLVCVRGAGAITRHGLRLPVGLNVTGSDAIRGHRVLMVGAHEVAAEPARAPWGGGAGWMEPFAVSIWIYDLETKRARKLATRPGAYTRSTAIPHPRVDVTWEAPDAPPSTARFAALEDGAHYSVDPVTEVVTP